MLLNPIVTDMFVGHIIHYLVALGFEEYFSGLGLVKIFTSGNTAVEVSSKGNNLNKISNRVSI